MSMSDHDAMMLDLCVTYEELMELDTRNLESKDLKHLIDKLQDAHQEYGRLTRLTWDKLYSMQDAYWAGKYGDDEE